MSNPKDMYKEIFGTDVPNKPSEKFETVDLDELLKSIDKELGDAPKIEKLKPLDYDHFEEIFGNGKAAQNAELKPEGASFTPVKTEIIKEDLRPSEKDPESSVKKFEYSSKRTDYNKTAASSDPFLEETKAIPAIRPSATLKSTNRLSPSDNKKPSRIYERAAIQNGRKQTFKEAFSQDGEFSDTAGGAFSRFRLTGIRYVLFVLIVSILLAYFSWMFVNDVFALNKPYVSATITVPQNFNMTLVANELKKAKIINYPTLFKIFGAIAKADKKIDPGMYKLSSELDYRALVSNMQEGSSEEVVKITIPEGKTMSEIFSLLEEKGVCTAARLKDTATNYNFNYKFLSNSSVGESKRLEGYLFPDTYEFYLNETSVNVIKKFLDNFDSRVTEDMYAQAKKLGYDMNKVIIVASLIEKESANYKESSNIASVIYNRLKSSSFPYLQIDATVQYALPTRKAKLSNDDLKIDSPYNTYKYKGLPPTAIASPGIESIKAALYPASTNYYFYALSKSGSHSFFTSSNDFDKFVSSSDYGG